MSFGLTRTVDKIAFFAKHKNTGEFRYFGPYGGSEGEIHFIGGRLIQAFYGHQLQEGIFQIGCTGQPF